MKIIFQFFFLILSEKDNEIITWWKDLYPQLYKSFDDNLNEENIVGHLDSFFDLMKIQNHLLYRNLISKHDLKNKNILEIGSGSGAHSALIKTYGANIISLDITLDRSLSTNKKLSLVKNKSDYLTINASAENLPIKYQSLDLVYSNEVLHHADNTNNCIK